MEGTDLLYKARISLVEALVGFKKKLTLPQGHSIVIDHDGVTSNGMAHVRTATLTTYSRDIAAYRKEFPGEGLPKLGSADDPEQRGSLIVEFDVIFPRYVPMTPLLFSNLRM